MTLQVYSSILRVEEFGKCLKIRRTLINHGPWTENVLLVSITKHNVPHEQISSIKPDVLTLIQSTNL